METFESISQALGFSIAAGVLVAAVIPVRVRPAVAAIFCTALAGVWLRGQDVTFWPMLPIGLLGIVVAIVIGGVLDGASRRTLGGEGKSGGDGSRSLGPALAGVVASALIAALAWIIPPSAYLWLAAILFLAGLRRRKRAEKHEGLRILR